MRMYAFASVIAVDVGRLIEPMASAHGLPSDRESSSAAAGRK